MHPWVVLHPCVHPDSRRRTSRRRADGSHRGALGESFFGYSLLQSIEIGLVVFRYRSLASLFGKTFHPRVKVWPIPKKEFYNTQTNETH